MKYWKQNKKVAGIISGLSAGIMLVLCVSCTDDGANPAELSAILKNSRDTEAPVIWLNGKSRDTVYLEHVMLNLRLPDANEEPKWVPTYADYAYSDPGVLATDNRDGDISALVEVSGTVNQRRKGTYFLTYQVKDAAGNAAVTKTRTVHVVESNAAFLNGNYDVACTCSITTTSGTTQLSTANYTASIQNSVLYNNRFSLSALHVGDEYYEASGTFTDTSLEFGVYLRPASYTYDSNVFGKISPSGDRVTIETRVQALSSFNKYHCKNTYTKKLPKE